VQEFLHAPFRQSKLTLLLQDALGGNSQTLFSACVSAADTNASETRSTLQYADRARCIQNAPSRNVDPSALEMHQWQGYVSVLQAELIQHKFGNSGSSPTGMVREELMKKKGANDYLDKRQMLAQQQQGTSITSVRLSSPPGQQEVCSANELLLFHDVNQPNLENFDPALLDEVNSDEEMAILDHLLDLQQDQDDDKELKRDYQAFKYVEGEWVEQEQLQLQLRESLKVYHNMKAKYDNLSNSLSWKRPNWWRSWNSRKILCSTRMTRAGRAALKTQGIRGDSRTLQRASEWYRSLQLGQEAT
jgi:Kinesin motor domain